MVGGGEAYRQGVLGVELHIRSELKGVRDVRLGSASKEDAVKVDLGFSVDAFEPYGNVVTLDNVQDLCEHGSILSVITVLLVGGVVGLHWKAVRVL